MVSAFAFDSTITSGFATGGSCRSLVGVAVQCGRRGGTEGVSAPESGVASGPCQLRVVPGGDRSGRLSCAVVAVVHLLSSILALSLDPKEILNDLSPYGEIGLMLIIFAETGLLVGFFLPGDSLLFTAGILANQGKLNLAAILLGCFAAAVIGDQVGFTIGQKTGPRLLRRPDSKLFKREYIDRTELFFDQHGPKTIVLARFVPVVRTFAPVVAGIGKMSRRTFFSFNIIGAFIWVFGVTLAGYALADAIGDSIDKYLYPLIAAIIVISLIPPFIEWRKAKRQPAVHFTQAQAEAEAAALHEVVEED